MNYTIEEIYQNIEVNERKFIIHADTGFSLPDTITATNCTYTYDSETGEVVITEATGDIVITANMVADTFNIAYNLTNVSGVGTLPTTATYGSIITITFEADSGYRMPTNVNVSGCSYTWQQSSGQYWELSLSEFTGNVTISIEGIRAYTITKMAVNATIQGANTIDVGGYSLYNITSDNGYYLPDTMIVNGFTVGNTTVDLGNSKARYEKQDDEWAILYLSDVYENITCSIGGIAYYTITTTITNATLDSVYIGAVLATPPYKIKHGQSVTLNLTANTDYEWVSGNYSCTMGGSSAGQFTVNGSSLQCYIQTVTGNITLTATATLPSFAFAATFTNITVTSIEVNNVVVSTIPSSVVSSDIVTLYISADSGYTLPDSITVNGTTVNNGSSYTTTSGCEVMYALSNLNIITLRNFTGNSTVSAVAEADTPTSYVIPAGLYYGKSVAVDYPDSGINRFNLEFVSNSKSFVSLYFDVDPTDNIYQISYFYSDDSAVDAYYYDNDPAWDVDYRTITVTTDTTVTQDEYNAFFACFDYAFTVSRVTTYGYGSLDMTWEQFVVSSYNVNNWYISGNSILDRDGGTLCLNIQGEPVYKTDTIIHSHDYQFLGGN